MQLSMGEELLEYARSVLDPGERVPSSVEYRWLACRLTEALSDALRVGAVRSAGDQPGARRLADSPS